jgi:hypothetical protein
MTAARLLLFQPASLRELRLQHWPSHVHILLGDIAERFSYLFQQAELLSDLCIQASQLPVIREGYQRCYRSTRFLHQDTALLLGNVVDQAYQVAFYLSDFHRLSFWFHFWPAHIAS